MSIGAADVPRGSDATANELEVYPFVRGMPDRRSGKRRARRKRSSRFARAFPIYQASFFFDLPDEARLATLRSSGEYYGYDDILSRGGNSRAEKAGVIELSLKKARATNWPPSFLPRVRPASRRAVMLNHGNCCQLDDLSRRIILNPATEPCASFRFGFHFERLCEYVILNGATAIVYSKPVGSVLWPIFRR